MALGLGNIWTKKCLKPAKESPWKWKATDRPFWILKTLSTVRVTSEVQKISHNHPVVNLGYCCSNDIERFVGKADNSKQVMCAAPTCLKSVFPPLSSSIRVVFYEQ